MGILGDSVVLDAEGFENCTLASALADRMRESRDDLTRRWLDRISSRVSLDPNRIFPTDALLDHVPLLILGIADYIENPKKVILAEVPVVAKAMELGELRFAQGFAVGGEWGGAVLLVAEHSPSKSRGFWA
ncbi:MAG: hypothetical protein ABR585_03060, partial [Gemmatimonadaceae bacterium]